jgi:hypothetical protein
MFPDEAVISAGHVNFSKPVVCWGKSIGLGISSNPEQDENLIAKAYNLIS